MRGSRSARIVTLQCVAKFLYCVAEGAPATKRDFKDFSNLCWLQVPVKYRMSKGEIAEIKTHPWENITPRTR
jgi:hypothetical protein